MDRARRIRCLSALLQTQRSRRRGYRAVRFCANRRSVAMDASERAGMELHRRGRSLDQSDLFEETLCALARGYLDPFAERGCICVGGTFSGRHTLPELEAAAPLGTVAVPRLASLASFDRFVRRS